MKRKRIENFVIFLNEELGKGSFGKVYKGVNELTQQPVAIKALPRKMIDQDQYVKDALLSEIKIVKKLKSANIVGFIDILETSNNYYVIQELCDGGDLKTALRKAKHFSEPQATQYLKQVCEGFQELIENSIIHRDVKPENILLHHNQLKLADFGFAKNVVSHNALQKSMVGTPLYMAPQILKRQKYTSKCDVWSIGVVFFEMLYGCLPWQGVSEYELINHIKTLPLTFPQNVEITEMSKDFLRGCLKHDEEKRFDWQEVYSHPIFNGYFTAFNEKTKKLNQKAGYVINNLRLEIHSQNIDLEVLFNKLKYSKATSLKKAQFYSLLKTLDPNISEQQSHYIFTKFDQDGSGGIEFQEFKEMLKHNEVRMTAISTPVHKKHESIMEEQEQQDKAIQTIIKLRQRIEDNDLSIEEVYHNCDKNNDDQLSQADFKELLLRLDSTMTQSQIQSCLKKFDINGDKQISFYEFCKTIKKISGESPSRRLSIPQRIQ